MAELATIARPYAEALFRSVDVSDATVLGAQLASLAQLARDAGLRQYADDPKVAPQQIYELIAAVALAEKVSLHVKVGKLLRAVIDNGRLAALPEIAAQFHALVNDGSGIADATIQSAFPIDPAQLTEVVAVLEQRFGRKLNATVEIAPELIGGIRVAVGDEVLDTSVKARLEQMRLALSAQA